MDNNSLKTGGHNCTCLSLVIPCYNEETTLESIVDEVLKL